MTFRQLWDRAVHRAEERNIVLGLLGRHNVDLSVSFAVAGRKDFVYVTLTDKTVTIARNEAGVPQTADLPVKLRLDHGTYVIVGRSNIGALAVPTQTPASGVLAHATSHQHGGTDEVGTATPAANAIVKADADGKIGAGWIDDADVTKAFTDLTDVPATYVGDGGKVVKVNVGETGLEFAAEAGALVTSVNGQTGVVVLDSDDIAEGVINLYFTTVEETKLAGIEALADVTDQGNVGSSIHGATVKTTPVDADTMPLIDSAASNVLKKVTWANIKDTLKTYFDTLYATATGWIKADGTVPLTAEWDIGEDMAIRAERIEARDVEGLRIEDDGGNLGVFVEDATGDVGISTATPITKLHVDATATAFDAAEGLAIFQDNGDRQIAIGGLGLFRRDQNGNADLRLNYLGYLGGVTQFRDLAVYDGKSVLVVFVDGSLGLVSIGTGSAAGAPVTTLHVSPAVGNDAANIPLQLDRNTPSTTGLVSASKLVGRSTGNMVDSFGAAFNMYIEDDAGVENLIARFAAARSGADNSGALTFHTSNAGASAERARVTNVGVLLVGIAAGNANVLGVEAGTSDNDAAVGGVLVSTAAGVGNVGTGEDTLFSYTVPGGTLAVNGQSLWFRGFGRIAINANSKILRVRFGSTEVDAFAFPTSSILQFTLDVECYRRGATTTRWVVRIVAENGNSSSVSAGCVAIVSATETLANNLVFSITGEATTTDDIVLDHGKLGWDDNNS